MLEFGAPPKHKHRVLNLDLADLMCEREVEKMSPQTWEWVLLNLSVRLTRNIKRLKEINETALALNLLLETESKCDFMLGFCLRILAK